MEAMAHGFELTSQLAVVVDLAIEDQGAIAIVGKDRLVSIFQVDYAQANGSERDIFGFENALLIGPAMMQRRDSLANIASAGRSTQVVCVPSDAAQFQSPLRALAARFTRYEITYRLDRL
jgi:hypothetical protein